MHAAQTISMFSISMRVHRGLTCPPVQAACALASGPVAAWPTLEPLLLDAGVWEKGQPHANMDAVFGVATAIQMGASLPAGWIYDKYGGRAASLGGALAAAAGLVLMSAACYWPAGFSWLLFIGYPLAMLGGQINSYGLFAFIWLLPDHQNFISSMIGSAQALSDMLALVAVALNTCCSFFVGDFFLVLSLLSVLSGIVCWRLVPPFELVNALAAATIAEQVPTQHY
jgi:MFS family permease